MSELTLCLRVLVVNKHKDTKTLRHEGLAGRNDSADHDERREASIEHHRVLSKFNGEDGAVFPAVLGRRHFDEVWKLRHIGFPTWLRRLHQERIDGIHQQEFLARPPIKPL